jgi:ABC-type nickel/cobalt efflux system permease component RcnA
MLFLLGSAIFVGFVHSLAPGHWLPVVILSKTRRWSLGTAALGAVIAASGHILISVVVASVAIGIGAELLVNYEEVIEKYAGLGLAVFGVAFAVFSFFRHSSCHGHEHHGPDPKQEKIRGLRTAIPFLLSIGFSPCIAVLPVFIAAAPSGVHAIAGTAVAFSIGVVAALVGSTLLVTLGCDHWSCRSDYGNVLFSLRPCASKSRACPLAFTVGFA